MVLIVQKFNLAVSSYGLSKSEQLGVCCVRYPDISSDDVERVLQQLIALGVPTKVHGTLYG